MIVTGKSSALNGGGQSVNHDRHVESNRHVEPCRCTKKTNVTKDTLDTGSPKATRWADIGQVLDQARELHAEAMATWEQWHTGTAEWMSPAFFLVRLLRADVEFWDRSADEALVEVERRMATELGSVEKGWARLADGFEPIEIEPEDGRVAFLDLWDKVRAADGQDWLGVAFGKAERSPVKLPTRIRRRTPGYGVFVSVAFHLQRDRPGDVILLPVDRLADLLGVEPMTISRYRKWAQEDGLLKEVRVFSRHRATEFRFNPKALADDFVGSGASGT